MARKVLIGTVSIEKDIIMTNEQFSYAADFERLMVKAGEYPIYAYAEDFERGTGCVRLGWRNYIGFEGTVIYSNVGGMPGEKTSYHQMVYDYILADTFCDGFEYYQHSVRAEYQLRPEWTIVLSDFDYDGKRHFIKRIVLKDGVELHYMD